MAYLAGKGNAIDLGSLVPLYQIITKIFSPLKELQKGKNLGQKNNFLLIGVRC